MNNVRTILAIDPGPVESGFAFFDIIHEKFLAFVKTVNENLKRIISKNIDNIDLFAVEMIASYGRVGNSVFETCIWIGRFVEYISFISNRPKVSVVRSKILSHFLPKKRDIPPNWPKSKDSRIRLVIKDRFGDQTAGMAMDAWQAAALAVYVADNIKTVAIPNKFKILF